MGTFEERFGKMSAKIAQQTDEIERLREIVEKIETEARKYMLKIIFDEDGNPKILPEDA